MDRLRKIRLIRRAALYAFLVAAMLFSQAAAQLHALSHLAYDLAKVETGGKSPLPPHPIEQCVAFHTVGSALPICAAAFEPPLLDSRLLTQVLVPTPLPPRIVFDSRAPPEIS